MIRGNGIKANQRVGPDGSQLKDTASAIRWTMIDGVRISTRDFRGYAVVSTQDELASVVEQGHVDIIAMNEREEPFWVKGAFDTVVLTGDGSFIVELEGGGILALDRARVRILGEVSMVTAAGSSKVDAGWSARSIYASEDASVIATGASVGGRGRSLSTVTNGRLELFEDARGVAKGGTYLQAFDTSHARVIDRSFGYITNSATAIFDGTSSGVADGDALAFATDLAVVTAAGKGMVVTTGDAVAASRPPRAKGYSPEGFTGPLERCHSGDGFSYAYKVVNSNLEAGHRWEKVTSYGIGSTVRAEDWDPCPEPGGGLHLSPTIAEAEHYAAWLTDTNEGRTPARLLHCRFRTKDAVSVGLDKVKVPELEVICEVDASGGKIRDWSRV